MAASVILSRRFLLFIVLSFSLCVSCCVAYYGFFSTVNLHDRWLLYRLDQGDATARVRLANRYQSKKQARSYSADQVQAVMQAFAQAGYIPAKVELGIQAYHQGEFLAALNWLSGVDEAYENAHFALGVIHSDGSANVKDVRLACEAFWRAAKRDHSEAQLKYAQMIMQGDCLQDLNLAEALLLKTAALGREEARWLLGKGYFDGTFGAQRERDAVEQLTMLAKDGHVRAQLYLGRLLRKNSPLKDAKQSVFWLSRAARQGQTDALYLLATMTMAGEGVDRDTFKVAQLYRHAAELGHPLAQNNLAEMYRRGTGVERNLTKAMYWFQKSAAQGETMPMTNLGEIYRDGESGPSDPEKAAFWFKQAAEKGLDRAQYALAEMHYERRLKNSEFAKAEYWMGQAKAQGYGPAQDFLKASNVATYSP